MSSYWGQPLVKSGFQQGEPIQMRWAEEVFERFVVQGRGGWREFAHASLVDPEAAVTAPALGALLARGRSVGVLTEEIPSGFYGGLLLSAAQPAAPGELLDAYVGLGGWFELAAVAALNPNAGPDLHEAFASNSYARHFIGGYLGDSGSEGDFVPSDELVHAFLRAPHVSEGDKALFVRRDWRARLAWLSLESSSLEAFKAEVELMGVAGQEVPGRWARRTDLDLGAVRLLLKYGRERLAGLLARNQDLPEGALAEIVEGWSGYPRVALSLVANAPLAGEGRVRLVEAHRDDSAFQYFAFCAGALPLEYVRGRIVGVESGEEAFCLMQDPRLEKDEWLPLLRRALGDKAARGDVEGFIRAGEPPLPLHIIQALTDPEVWRVASGYEGSFEELTEAPGGWRRVRLDEWARMVLALRPDTPSGVLRSLAVRLDKYDRLAAAGLRHRPGLSDSVAEVMRTGCAWGPHREMVLEAKRFSARQLAESAYSDRDGSAASRAESELLYRVAWEVEEAAAVVAERLEKERQEREAREAREKAELEAERERLREVVPEAVAARTEPFRLYGLARSLKVPKERYGLLEEVLEEVGIPLLSSGRYLPPVVRVAYEGQTNGMIVAQAMMLLAPDHVTPMDLTHITGLTREVMRRGLEAGLGKWAKREERGVYSLVMSEAEKFLSAAPPPQAVHPNRCGGYGALSPVEAIVLGVATSAQPMSLEQVKSAAEALGVPGRPLDEYEQALRGLKAVTKVGDDRYELSRDWVRRITHNDWMELAVIAKGKPMSGAELRDWGSARGRNVNYRDISSAVTNSKSPADQRLLAVAEGSFAVKGFMPQTLREYWEAIEETVPDHHKLQISSLAKRTNLPFKLVQELRRLERHANAAD